MVKETKAYTRWTPDEYLTVAANALQFMDQGQNGETSFFRAQKLCLRQPRWRSMDELHKVQTKGKKNEFGKYSVLARALPAGELTKLQSIRSADLEPDDSPDTTLADDKRQRITWTSHIEAIVSKEAQRLKNGRMAGNSLPTIFHEAQNIIPEPMRKTHKSFVGMNTRQLLFPMFNRGLSLYPQFADKPVPWYVPAPEATPAPQEQPAAAAPVEAPAAAEAPPAPAGKIPFSSLAMKPYPPRVGLTMVKWTTREKALLARAFDSIDSEGSSDASVLMRAQQIALPSDRWKVKQSIWDMGSRKLIPEMLAEGRRHSWILDPEPVAAPVAAAPAEPPAPEPQETAQEPAEVIPAPIPLLPSSAGLARASEAFAATMAEAMGRLLQENAVHMLASLDARIAGIAQGMGAAIGASIAAQFDQGLRRIVVDTMTAELGGPVQPPAADPAPAPFVDRPKEDGPPPAPAVNEWQAQQAAALMAIIKPDVEPGPAAQIPEAETFTPRKLKVDVVGFTMGAHIDQVRKAFNGNTDLEFYTPDEKTRYKPHKGRHCVMLIDRIPHSMRLKLDAAKVRPILVKGTPFNVIHAIEELHRSKGIPQ